MYVKSVLLFPVTIMTISTIQIPLETIPFLRFILPKAASHFFRNINQIRLFFFLKPFSDFLLSLECNSNSFSCLIDSLPSGSVFCPLHSLVIFLGYSHTGFLRVAQAHQVESCFRVRELPVPSTWHSCSLPGLSPGWPLNTFQLSIPMSDPQNYLPWWPILTFIPFYPNPLLSIPSPFLVLP